jgi:hypothetical protein
MEVWCGEAKSTRYGLTKDGLVMSRGKVVSKAKHDHAMANKQEYVQKMNVRRRTTRAQPPPARPNSPARFEAVQIPAHRPRATPELTSSARLKKLLDAASRTY